MISTRLIAFVVAALVLTACGGPGATTRPTPGPTTGATSAPTTAPTASPAVAATVCDNLPTGSEGDLLATICERGRILVNTDPNYAPQSFLNPDGTFEGFDIDTANEIGERLGVDVEFTTNGFDLVVAGGWNGRWDISVGSVTITEERIEVLDFTQPYYYTPAQMAASTTSGITTMEGLVDKSVCVGSQTTYQFWLEGTLSLNDAPEPAEPPSGAVPFPLDTDQLCAQAISSGRTDFDGWLSSSTTVQAAIDADTPIVLVGDPVFYESLGVATDKNGPEDAALQAALDDIIGAMHEDGTLTASSENWFGGLDLTQAQ